jgi:hypothetical protein
MASSYRLKHLSNPGILKKMAFPLLLRLLEPYRDYLQGRGLTWADREDGFDYAALAVVLASPTEETPEVLLDALYIIDATAEEELFDDIRDRAAEAGVDLGGLAEPSPADLAALVWLERPALLEQIHAEQHLTRPRRFVSFLSRRGPGALPAQPPPEVLTALQEDLDRWFAEHKKGHRAVRVFFFPRQDGAWLLVRHGLRITREGTVESDGRPGRVYYRPEKFDVLIYHAERGELAIHTATKGEQEAYCRRFGRHLLGDEGYFDFPNVRPKYTLRPIIARGRAALACRPDEYIEAVRLVELQFLHDSRQRYVEIHRADDVFDAMEEKGRRVPEDALLVCMKLQVLFAGASRWRSVVLRTPNVAVLDRDSDSEAVHAWLDERGFLRGEEAEAGDVADEQTVAVP